jgi:hypothetical protein
MNNKLVYIVAGAALLLGSVGSIAIQAYAQSTNATPTTTPVVQTQTSAQTQVQDQNTTNDKETNDPGDVSHGHRPLGGDGVVSSITGSTIVMGEESDEGSVSYTVDASSATITNNGAAAQLSDIKVGDKIFVEGAVTGTNVKATSVSLGHPGYQKDSEPAGTPETNDDGGTSASSN